MRQSHEETIRHNGEGKATGYRLVGPPFWALAAIKE